ncbi:uncharacterized protein LOC120353198 [Nilaparvata lugens]|uniref:uncharacterized protein LOC120352176 n=1 Tax=Nilaparvata lugens TaxID=108931 RepID=UPI00193E68E8|nr:uncharacterized protein LOC120352176 [Nilaparvata lugens]XP_039291943.1 uncharacterized protein LOC120353198 [Nilaparvata lugens]
MAELQRYTRKDNLILSGVPESKNESVFEVFDQISNILGSSMKSKDCLSIAHRMPGRVQGAVKPIVYKFIKRQDKLAWLNDFKKMASKDKSGPGISTSVVNKKLPAGRIVAHDHLPPFFLELFKKAKQQASTKGYKFVWIRDGKILLRKVEGGQVLHIRDEKDLSKIT